MSATEIVLLKTVVTERDHAVGPADAPVTLLEYGNFECVHCGAFYRLIEGVRKRLGDKVRFVFRHFPTVRTHPHAIRAAEAVEAAAAQGRFWQMHNELFTHQQFLEDQHLFRYAKRIGLEMERFETALMEHTFLQQIDSDYERALFDEHITGTPTIYINHVRHTRLTDQESILRAIKEVDKSGRINFSSPAKGLKRVLRGLQHRTGSNT